MHNILDFLKELKDLDKLSALVNQFGGLYIIALVIFAETGLFIGFFLPGDSLLFLTGALIARQPVPFANNYMNLIYWIILISIAGIIGNMVGYWFGRKTGPVLFERKDTLLFKRKHLIQASEFYEKRGGVAIILARFLPIVRTFAPIVAGVVKMEKGKFLLYNVAGSFIWVAVAITCGFFMGGIPWVNKNFEWIIVGLIVVTTGPVLLKMIFGKNKPVLATGKDIVEETLK